MSLKSSFKDSAPRWIVELLRIPYNYLYYHPREWLLKRLDSWGVIGPNQIYESDWYAKRQNDDWLHDGEVVANELNNAIAPDSVIDFGCGIGRVLRGFEQLGIDDIYGVDGVHAAKEHSVIERRFGVADLREPFDTRTRDLSISIELLEHIPEKYADTLVKTIAKAGKWVVVTAAPPGQGGTHHVNLQPKQYWIDKFESQGKEYDPQLTHSIQTKLAGSLKITTWIPENIMVFRPK